MADPILWEGRILLSRIRWQNVSSQEYELPQNLEAKRFEIWHELKTKEPWSYDGKLLFLEEFSFKTNSLNLEVSSIRFSSVITMLQTGERFCKGLGVLGVQCMIFSPTREFFLIGVRRKDQSYRPRHKAIPGGMLEERDAHIPPRVSLMREIYEETRLSLERDVNLVTILREQSFLSTVLLLEAHLDEDSGFSPEQQIDGGDEWEGKLKWISLTELEKMTRSNLMEGLVYYHSKL